ncbi:unnamed protein product [Moneuplotes crassus]|uniref:Uncharacterized protein n=1 Tax=Euplotes crassus TaxID=5936 RepID=A0AAD1XFU5_EUPCR|nr:unnamed protein product [Moneuplotes crassus]
MNPKTPYCLPIKTHSLVPSGQKVLSMQPLALQSALPLGGLEQAVESCRKVVERYDSWEGIGRFGVRMGQVREELKRWRRKVRESTSPAFIINKYQETVKRIELIRELIDSLLDKCENLLGYHIHPEARSSSKTTIETYNCINLEGWLLVALIMGLHKYSSRCILSINISVLHIGSNQRSFKESSNKPAPRYLYYAAELRVQEKSLEIEKSLWFNATQNICRMCINYNLDCYFDIWIDHQNYQRLLKKMASIRLPNISELLVYDCSLNNKRIRNFLWSMLPRQCKIFVLESNSLIRMNRNIAQITKASHLCTEKITIWKFKIGSSHLKRLLMANRYKRKVLFTCCQISLPVIPDLSDCLRGTTIEYLGFEDCGKRENSCWKNNLEEFENLVESLSKSDLKKSLKQIELNDCSLTISDVNKIFESNGLGHIIVSGHFKVEQGDMKWMSSHLSQ